MMGVEPTLSAWKAGVLTDIRHLHISVCPRCQASFRFVKKEVKIKVISGAGDRTRTCTHISAHDPKSWVSAFHHTGIYYPRPFSYQLGSDFS